MDKEKNDLVHALTAQVESQQATITELKAVIHQAIGVYSLIEPSNESTRRAVNMLKAALKEADDE